MTDVWVTSDTHFGHENIIKYCGRPFKSVYEMNECLLNNWNSVVKPNDRVYHLGDVYFSSGFREDEAWYFLQRLHGKKTLILGNHDNPQNQLLTRLFSKITLLCNFKKERLLLTHMPVWTGPDFGGMLNVHGHIHEKPSPTKRHKNVSVEWTNYTPIHIDQLIKEATKL